MAQEDIPDPVDAIMHKQDHHALPRWSSGTEDFLHIRACSHSLWLPSLPISIYHPEAICSPILLLSYSRRKPSPAR